MANYNAGLIQEIKRVSERTPNKYSEASIIINFLLQQLEQRDITIAELKADSLCSAKAANSNVCNASTTELPHTLTPKHIMQIMNIGRNQAYELIRTRSDLPKFYVGRCPKIPRDAFFKWYDEVWMSREIIEMEN